MTPLWGSQPKCLLNRERPGEARILSPKWGHTTKTRSPHSSHPFAMTWKLIAPPVRLELTTNGFEVRYSVQLSYGGERANYTRNY